MKLPGLASTSLKFFSEVSFTTSKLSPFKNFCLVLAAPRKFQLLGILACLLFMSACGSQPVEEELEEALYTSVDQVDLKRSRLTLSDEEVLDIGIGVFDVEQENTGPAAVGDWIFEQILDIESQYLPSVLRDTLIRSNYWGVVRVLPENDPSIDLQIQGVIHQSDGTQLDVTFIAKDSTGREWLNQRYVESKGSDFETNQFDRKTGQTRDAGYPLAYVDPFQSTYNQFANDLAAIFTDKTDQEVRNIKSVTEMIYASDLSPETFSDTLAQDEEGYTQVVRLLADNDPMVERLQRMRLRHHVFIDTLDEYYAALQQDTQLTYDLWRVYSREQILEVETYDRREDDAGDSGFLAISNNWYRYKSNRIFEQEWNELAQGFADEVAPSILELNSRVYGLSGSVQDQYEQWRELLRQFYLQDRGSLD